MVKLIRNLETEKNKEQEDSFENSLNLILFFDTNKIIQKIESWNITNIKRICSNEDVLNNVIFEYSKWNSNVQYLINNIKIVNEFETYKMSKDDKEPFLNKNIKGIHQWIKNNKEKEKQFALLLFIALETKNNKKIINVINNVLNNGISNLEFAIDFILPLFLIGDKNE